MYTQTRYKNVFPEHHNSSLCRRGFPQSLWLLSELHGHLPLIPSFRSLVLTFGWINVIKKLSTPKPVRTVPVGDGSVPSHRVLPENNGNLVNIPSNGAKTLYEVFNKTLLNHGSNLCMRNRHFLGWKTKKIKEFSKKITDLTYNEVGEQAYKFGAALAATGCLPSDPTATLDKVNKPCRIVWFFFNFI